MFGIKHSTEGTSWSKRFATAEKPQSRAKGGKGNAKNTGGGGIFPKDRNKIVRGYGTKKG